LLRAPPMLPINLGPSPLPSTALYVDRGSPDEDCDFQSDQANGDRHMGVNSLGSEITNRFSPPRPRPGGRPGPNRRGRSLRPLRVCSSRCQSGVRVHDHRESPCLFIGRR
jgi:hypothetical protein